MIFATVGTQLPFDRLLLGLNSWAMRNPDVPVFAQAGTSTRDFSHIKTVSHLSQSDFQAHFEAARLVVAHAGMGSMLLAAELGKPIVLMPRRAKFREHRNDHQQDTANKMGRSITDDSLGSPSRKKNRRFFFGVPGPCSGFPSG